jgi:hypothetical protein
MGDGGARTAAPVTDLAEEGQVPEADRLRQLDLVGLLHRVGGEGVDLARGDPGVVEGGEYGTAGQGPLVLGELLGEGGLPDPDDGGRVLESGHALSRHALCMFCAPPRDTGAADRASGYS